MRREEHAATLLRRILLPNPFWRATCFFLDGLTPVSANYINYLLEPVALANGGFEFGIPDPKNPLNFPQHSMHFMILSRKAKSLPVFLSVCFSPFSCVCIFFWIVNNPLFDYHFLCRAEIIFFKRYRSTFDSLPFCLKCRRGQVYKVILGM